MVHRARTDNTTTCHQKKHIYIQFVEFENCLCRLRQYFVSMEQKQLKQWSGLRAGRRPLRSNTDISAPCRATSAPLTLYTCAHTLLTFLSDCIFQVRIYFFVVLCAFQRLFPFYLFNLFGGIRLSNDFSLLTS